ncbi:hypothetical protein A2524_01730 [Candidatus Wolfebacteria bacterium RIFOXYD12_FULL_48_21]|uniref:Addiction module toxin RelE n=1 Tax=Candidatus Wolfebacteria bacterium RIFOXYD1_FULL_48_65 TaxID=1802561 RepID=A0A1F8DZI3_9BACT|nr:MAG: hypothetical protein A2610_03705 [Candidatus Wolfebacteria bacterium RIFOXYD1_FULL_48_65]OGM94519.1 MAG: hypothetical protein A2524_01730 [Candidatus Wolfebacteria bacterium RIFOXYD12_FULL_48_21]OGM96185.1 MAG: hypothetical protein A2532_00995 [Candidatus Wolfebacteria bacterium RIFOXYD2_FULL_48_11]
MYIIKRTRDFDKSFTKLVRAGITDKQIGAIKLVIDTLAIGQILDKKYRDHQLKGKLGDYRECHVLNDLLLMYRIEEDELLLTLIDIGSHSQLFG